jgi:hypothetical protein
MIYVSLTKSFTTHFKTHQLSDNNIANSFRNLVENMFSEDLVPMTTIVTNFLAQVSSRISTMCHNI